MHHRPAAALVVVAVLGLTACAADAPAADAASEATAGFPLTLENCGETITLDAPPERVVLLESAPVTILDALGVLDRVVSRAGNFAPEYYDVELRELLLLDEPTNHLDVHAQHEVLHLVRDLGRTTVVVLHDLNLAARYADRLVLLDSGRVMTEGAPEEVLASAALDAVLRVEATPVRAPDTRPQLLFRRAGS
jgi:hypothetical protein